MKKPKHFNFHNHYAILYYETQHLTKNYFSQVTEEHSLNTAKRLHVSEKGWVKLANHFTILLSDKDTEILTKLQTHVDSFR